MATWAITTGHLAAGIPGLVNGPAAVLILTRLVQARRMCAAALRKGAALAGRADEPVAAAGRE